MSTCSNCYNGCSEIVSDQCVRYTGVNVPLLGVTNGDSLSYVEQAIITFLGSVLDGSGIKITLDEADYCTIVSDYLQQCQEVTALDLFRAVVKAACAINTKADANTASIATIEAAYTPGCVSAVTGTEGTHDVLQAVINKLCTIDTALTALALDVDTNYVKIADFGDLVDAYLTGLPTSTKYYNKMIPYTIVEYYGSLTNFDGTGAGIGDWEQIYLCNGQNNTPDKRGRVSVGAVSGVPGGTLDAAVNPASSPFNPNYTLGAKTGTNSITLTSNEIPSHTHTATVTDPGHKHTTIGTAWYWFGTTGLGNLSSNNDAVRQTSTNRTQDALLSSFTGITVSNSSTGGGEAHNNIQPTIAVHYIMYIPN